MSLVLMAVEEIVYEEAPLDEMEFDSETSKFLFVCPCGDLFEISIEELRAGERIARCPSCSLQLKVLIEQDELEQKLAELTA